MITRTRFASRTFLVVTLIGFAACATRYQAQPLPFRLPSSYPNATRAGGAVIGCAEGANKAGMARQKVMKDFRRKSLENKDIEPGGLSYGFLFFPAEAKSAGKLRLQAIERPGGKKYTVEMTL